ncbi:MAG: ATP-binding protein [Micrococcales bacterium]
MHAKQIAQQLLDLVDEGTAMPILLIDGRAGSGKSTLAAEVQNEYFKIGESAPRIVHLDDLYPGWQGLAAGVEYLQREVLNPLTRREVAQYQIFDWATGERGEWREFAGGTPLIVEGCGAINSNSIENANLSIWLDTDEETRHERWINREGSDEHWAEWAAQELDFYAREHSRELASQII